MPEKLALGVDIGGTNIRLAVVDENGTVVDRSRQEARLSRHDANEPDAAAALVLDVMDRAIRPMLDRHPAVQGIGIGFPGFFDVHQGLLLSSPNIPGLQDFPLDAMLGKRLACPVQAQNDASVAALGEFRFGAGKGAPSLLHLTLGTGVGGGVVLGHQLYTCDGGMAMEIGHMHVAPDDRICGCGARGCLETWASATAVAERFAALSGKSADARDVTQLADEGDQHALTVLHDAGRTLGRAIAEAVKLLDIRRVSISGGLTGAWNHLAPALQQELDAHLIPPLVGKIEVLRSSLADDAGILGGAAMVFD